MQFHSNRKFYAFVLSAVVGSFSFASSPGLAEHLTVVPADQANKQAFVTNKGINWYSSLDDAQAEAKKEGKLIFWVHMLGTMDGAT